MRNNRTGLWMWALVWLAAMGVELSAAEPAGLKVVGDWKVGVYVSGSNSRVSEVEVEPPMSVQVNSEKIEALPVFNPNAPGWVKGYQLRGVRAQETTTPFLVEPGSLTLKLGEGADAVVLKQGVDYEVDSNWGTVGRLAGGRIAENKTVYASYRHAQLRLDAVILDGAGSIFIRKGIPLSAAPLPPEVRSGERHLGNVWIPGRIAKLGPEHLFPILEASYPEKTQVRLGPSVAEQRLPKTMTRLSEGRGIKILAWGDSVTVGTYVPNPERERWQEQFVARLRAQYPKASIELVTEAWGGRNTGSYLNEPPGSEHNYQEKVLALKPDLIVSEFVNDAGLNPAQVAERYGRLWKDFQDLGTEWIILTPHYVRPDWMGLNRERDIDEDPRQYVAGLRTFAVDPQHQTGLALADASLRYGRLWRQGIPYTTLMLNSINHPDARGMKIFADSLMELFR